jgi:alpha-L-arabinofuranosidase
VEIPPPDVPRLVATASRDNQSGEVILKVVNPTANATEVDLDLRGIEDLGRRAEAIVLTGGPEDENSLTEPGKIVPQTGTLEVSGPKFQHAFRPYSLSILRFDVN